MNNKFKKYLTQKNMIIAISICVAIYIITSFYNIFTNKNGILGGNVISNEKLSFSKYEVYNENIITLFFSESNKFYFKNSENEIIYSTDDFIEDFVFVDESSILFSKKKSDVNNNTQYDVSKLDLSTNTEEIILSTAGNIYLAAIDGVPYVINNSTKEVFMFDNKASKLSYDSKMDKFFRSASKLYSIKHVIDNNITKTKVFHLTSNGFEELFLFPGYISHISMDYNNDNLIYITHKSELYTNPNAEYIVSRYAINLSPSDSGEKLYTEISGRIISTSTGYYLLDTSKSAIYKLNDEFVKESSPLAYIYKSYPLSMVKVDPISGKLFYITSSNKIDCIGEGK